MDLRFCWIQKLLIDVNQKEQTEQPELLTKSSHEPQTQIHTVTAALGEGWGRHWGRDRGDRGRALPTVAELPTLLPPAERPRTSKNQRKTGGKTILQAANNQKNQEYQKTKNIKKRPRITTK
jgi:hypothetical protein